MRPDLQRRVTDLLRAQPTRSLPLRDLHRALVAGAGGAIGSYARLAEQLRAQACFVVVEPQDPFVGSVVWPAELRSAYRNAIRASGLEPDTRVLLTELEGSDSDPLRAAEHALIELWVTDADPSRHQHLADALAELDAMRGSLHPALNRPDHQSSSSSTASSTNPACSADVQNGADSETRIPDTTRAPPG